MTSSLLKEGTKYLTGVNDAILKNLEAVQDLSVVTRTSMGPNGKDNHFQFILISLRNE
jgi:T-complex protein 1 subunit theta